MIGTMNDSSAAPMARVIAVVVSHEAPPAPGPKVPGWFARGTTIAQSLYRP